MALPASGQITLNQVNVELGNSGTAQIDMGGAAVRGLFGIASGEIEMSDGYGKSSETVLPSAGTINGQSYQKEITVSSFISSGGTLRIPSTIWVWSDSITTAALTVDIPCTIINEGKIIGRGGSYTNGGNGQTGGFAVKINSSTSGVTITNSSGAYIAGGGGGGGGDTGGGGGAGGGLGLYHSSVIDLNGTGANGANPYGGGGIQGGFAGGAGGGGGSYTNGAPGGGGDGGRILPGVGGAGGCGSWCGGNGGSAGNNGNNGVNSGFYAFWSGGGGGGWSGSGGQGGYGFGGSGGSAINDSGNSYTLSNSGTIYGAT